PGVDTRYGAEHVQRVLGNAAARDVLGYVGGRTAVNLRLERLAEAQLQPTADHVPNRGAHLHPSVGAENHVDAVGESAGDQLRHVLVQAVEVLLQHLPAIDNEEQVRIGRCLPPASLHHGGESAFGELSLAPLQRCGELRHGPADELGVPATGDAADVGQVDELAQSAAAEIEAVELDLLGRVGEGEGGHHG